MILAIVISDSASWAEGKYSSTYLRSICSYSFIGTQWASTSWVRSHLQSWRKEQ